MAYENKQQTIYITQQTARHQYDSMGNIICEWDSEENDWVTLPQYLKNTIIYAL